MREKGKTVVTENIRVVTGELTPKGLEGNFGGDGNVLNLDCDGAYIAIQNLWNFLLKRIYKLHANKPDLEKLKLPKRKLQAQFISVVNCIEVLILLNIGNTDVDNSFGK